VYYVVHTPYQSIDVAEHVLCPLIIFFAVKEEIAPKLRDRLGYTLTVEREREKREREKRERERERVLGTIISHHVVMTGSRGKGHPSFPQLD
jgi:hypothetical protein